MHLMSESKNGSGMTLGGSSILPTVAGRVTVTPLTSRPGPTPVNAPICSHLINKVLVKAFTKGSKTDSKISTQKNINLDEVSSVHKLERVVRDQLFDAISWSTFDIGYIQGSHMRTSWKCGLI